jgi:shikimate kinase
MTLQTQPDVRHVACIGLMGAGKSTVGHLLADRLGWGYVDVDELIEQRTGCTVGALWEVGGEDAYRPFERDIVIEVLSSDERSVLATPGGVVLDKDATHAIEAGDVVAVYLRARPETLARRIGGDDQSRPLLDDHPEEALRTMFTARDHCYEELADHVVQVDDLGPGETADAVIDVLTGAMLRST